MSKDLILEFFAHSPAPVVFVDKELRILRANDSAKALYPNLAVPDGLSLLLPSQSLEEYKKKVRSGEGFSIPDSSFLISGASLAFTPFEEGAMVSFLMPYHEDNNLKSVGAARSIAALTGQLRSPLSNIFAMLGVVSQRLHNEGDYSLDKYLNEISQSSYLMLREVVNLSELIKYNACMPDRNQRVVDLWTFLGGALESAAALTKSIGIPLEFDLPAQSFPVRCEPERLLVALFNILSNSCRFTKENNKITVLGSMKDNKAMITMVDRGLGIPAKYIGQVFEPFYSYDPEGTPYAGTGIGLTVARLIITSYKGSFNITSTELEGTSVAFTLPMSNVPSDSLLEVNEHAVDYLRNRFSPLYIGMCQACSGPSL